MCANNTDSRTCSEIVANNKRLLQILNILNSFCKPSQKKSSTSWYDAKWQFDGRLRIPSVEQPIQHLFGTPYFSSFVCHSHLYWRQLSPPVVFFFRHSKMSETFMVTSGWVGELLPPICPNQEICFSIGTAIENKYDLQQIYHESKFPWEELGHTSTRTPSPLTQTMPSISERLNDLAKSFACPWNCVSVARRKKYFMPKIENPKINVIAVLQPTEPTSSFASKSGGNHVGREFKIPT